jgi:hypothetical protein
MTKTLRFAPVAVKKILRWSFNDIIHTCVQFDNCQLSEQLFLEVTNMHGSAGLMYIMVCSLSIDLYIRTSLIAFGF